MLAPASTSYLDAACAPLLQLVSFLYLFKCLCPLDSALHRGESFFLLIAVYEHVFHADGHQAHAPVDEKLLSWIHLRCGIEERCPAGTAVRRVVRAMLRPEKSTLPRLLWRAACMQSIRWLQETVDCMHAASESSESESDAPAALLKHIHKMERDTMDRGPAKPTGVPGAMNSASLPQAFSTGNEISSQPRMQQQAVEAILGASPGRHFSMSIQRDGDATGGGTRSHSFPSAQLVPQQGDLSGDRHRPSDDGPKKMQPPVVGDSFQLTWEQLPTAALVVCQQMLYEAHQVLKEDTEQVILLLFLFLFSVCHHEVLKNITWHQGKPAETHHLSCLYIAAVPISRTCAAKLVLS